MLSLTLERAQREGGAVPRPAATGLMIKAPYIRGKTPATRLCRYTSTVVACIPCSFSVGSRHVHLYRRMLRNASLMDDTHGALVQQRAHSIKGAHLSSTLKTAESLFVATP